MAPDPGTASFAAFAGHEMIAQGLIEEVALRAKQRVDTDETVRVAIYNDETCRAVDIDYRGSDEEVVARLSTHPMLAPPAQQPAQPAERRGPGRPKLGVVSREISLLPRHWDWLGQQRGNASATLRRLVDEARKHDEGRDQARQTHEAIHRFLWDMAGDFPYFEEVCRVLDQRDYARLDRLIDEWPRDVRRYVRRLVDRL